MGGGGSKNNKSNRSSSSGKQNDESGEGSSSGEAGSITDGRKDTPTEVGSSKTSHSGIILSKELIDFGLTEACPLNETVIDHFNITNNTAKKIRFKFDPIPNSACKIAFIPATGQLPPKKKNSSASRKIDVKMQLLHLEPLNFRVNLRINGGETLFLTVRAHPDLGVFGADPLTLDMIEDEGFEVPEILVSMKNWLTERDAFLQEGIFRLAGEAVEMKRMKEEMNQSKKFVAGDTDLNTVANLMKVWYRDLPTPILNVLPSSTIAAAGDREVCIEAYSELPVPQKPLLGWLLAILVEVATNRKETKMSAQNLAIVVAPNLYDPPSSDPMEGLVMSQKAVQFLHNLLLSELEQRGDNGK